MIAAGAVLAIGASVGTGFAVQSAWAAENDRVEATAALAISTGLHSEQLPAHVGVLDVRAASAAESALKTASDTAAAASGKADATGLQTTAKLLGDYKLLAPQRVFALVNETKSQASAVQAAVAEFDRVAAEKAAAEAAAKAAAAATSTAASRPNAPSDPSAAQAYARDYMAASYGWGDDQFGCLVALWNKESGWNANSYNASSGAGGIPQAVPASKMASAGADWATNAETQVRWGLGYIASRWGTPCAAWDHSESSGWY